MLIAPAIAEVRLSEVPLSERFAITGAAKFVTPTAAGAVDAYHGQTFFPGRGAVKSMRSAFAPFTRIANTDIRRRPPTASQLSTKSGNRESLRVR
jgi:hypothetical protein